MGRLPVTGIPDRVVPMRVIVCGLNRTGSLSMRVALWQLGFHDCYHMHSVLQNPDSHPDQWTRALEAKYAGKGSFGKADWDRLLGDCQATCGMPASLFGVELAELYPDAKVVIVSRDPEKWYDSALNSIHKVLQGQSLAVRALRLYSFALDEQLRNWVRFTTAMAKLTMPFDHVNEKDKAIAWFEARYDEFRDRIPAERRIEFRVQDGWKPLCEHLGVPVPMVEDEATGKLVEAPFPHVNDRESFLATSQRGLQRSMERANKKMLALSRLLAAVALGYLAQRAFGW